MRTCHRFLVALAFLALFSSRADAQRRRYLLEVSGGGAYMSFDDDTRLHNAFGGVGRIGVWLPLHLSVEGEALLTAPSTALNGLSWTARFFSGSVLENIPFGRASSFFLRLGYGTSRYDSHDPDTCGGGRSVIGSGPCGSTPVVIGGLGVRVAVTPTVMIRAEGAVNHGTVHDDISGADTHLTNVGGALSLSLMLGSKPATDVDHDGVFDTKDRCPGTPRGVIVDVRGCPTDTDRDGIPDGPDRCPTTLPGTVVDTAGCARDSDKDGVPDGIDRCPNSPSGAAVDSTGCPVDSDKDGVFDGLDRCPDTPAGATVDQLGCPGDEDNDGVLDGLDRCPRTPIGQSVNAFGCPPSAGVPPAGGNEPGRAGAVAEGGTVLRGVDFAVGSARLSPASYPVLDSLARVLIANPSMSVEIGGHTDNSGNAAANRNISRLRAEAVRNYLIAHKVPFTRLVAKGYGSSQPLTTDTTAAARSANRRVEIRLLPPQSDR